RGLAYGEQARKAQLAHRQPESDNLFALAERDFAKGLTLKLKKLETYNLLVNRGTTRYLQEKYTEAAQDFKQAIQIQPNQFQAYVDLAQVCQDRAQVYTRSKAPAQAAAQFQQALTLLNQAIALAIAQIPQPNPADLYRNRALLHRQRGDLPAAVQDLDTTIQ